MWSPCLARRPLGYWRARTRARSFRLIHPVRRLRLRTLRIVGPSSAYCVARCSAASPFWLTSARRSVDDRSPPVGDDIGRSVPANAIVLSQIQSGSGATVRRADNRAVGIPQTGFTVTSFESARARRPAQRSTSPNATFSRGNESRIFNRQGDTLRQGNHHTRLEDCKSSRESPVESLRLRVRTHIPNRRRKDRDGNRRRPAP